MKHLKTLFDYVCATAVAILLVSCGNSVSNTPAQTQSETAEPESDPSKIVQCYDARGNATQAAAAFVIDSAKIVYEHRPSEIVLSLRNVSSNVLGNLKGVISLFGEDGLRYDDVDFTKSCKFLPGESGTISIYLGDKRVHPNQEWNRNVKLHFARTSPGRFSFIGSDNNWCECIAKVVEIRINSFEVFE